MKQLGNLALVCADRADVDLEVSSGQVFVSVDGSVVMSSPWKDDEKIESMIRELNFGKFKAKGA